MRRVVGYFHRSAVATSILREKQKLLQLPEHKLVIDVSTRWNSAVDMISRYLEQQPAIYAAPTSTELRKRGKDISALSERELTYAEELVAVLTLLKIATTALCEKSVPTLSMILPLQHQLLNCIMKARDDDSALIKQVKKEVVNDFSTRYQDTCTKKDLTTLDAHHELTVQAVFSLSSVKSKAAVKVDTSEVAQSEATVELPALPNFPNESHDDLHTVPSPAKKMRQETKESESVMNKPTRPTAMSSLFGDIYMTSVQQPKSEQDICEAEVSQYKKELSINATENPLTWWRQNNERYPSLAILAKKYLCIPATSVPSERVFSTAGDIVTAQRSQLKSEHVDRLIFLKKNWNP
ncbi:E3 SUMO-protein ligase ZBED1 [Acropora cervicornis]|uniref:E3 SUMO-protein ligase ZBED1 n=1 Tax=Acropora cervicornis TaxID=6130 RepID=A0AAD9V170_ACRCE|nr:E3 SUMO-protein ligase ZBED1 [Acropora cervicornis]